MHKNSVNDNKAVDKRKELQVNLFIKIVSPAVKSISPLILVRGFHVFMARLRS